MTSDTQVIGIDTTELDDFLTYAEKELAISNTEQRHRFFDDLIRLSGNRFGLAKARIVADRLAAPPTAVIKIMPTREFIETIDNEVARRRKERASG